MGGALLAAWALLTASAMARDVRFADTTWDVRSGYGGPGPNVWSDSEESVWVDDAGLHLKLRRIDGVWHAAEVSTRLCTRYGTHRFFVDADLEDLDPNLVAAAFLYRDDLNELDFEFARWGDPAADVGQFVVQPSAVERFPLGLTGSYSTHTLEWRPWRAAFQSVHGHHVGLPDPGNLIHRWAYTGADLPAMDGMRVHLNLWLMAGLAPIDGSEAEVVFTDADLPPLRPCP